MLRCMALACVLVAGCLASRREQLEKVAKDWCLTIRASQVIPVYPLTEDLQPGDLFLVQETVDTQHDTYEERGFLALDNHIGRLDPSGYQPFYDRSFKVGGPDKPVPETWLDENPMWSKSPTAAFPSYTFATSRSGGFNIALPISGVPVGMSLLGARRATGSVTIADARTYGVDIDSLYVDLIFWWADSISFLYPLRSNSARKQYVRVVSRVYLTGKLNVSLQETRSFGGGISAGVAKPVELLDPKAGAAPAPAPGSPPAEGAPPAPGKNAAAAYADGLKALNQNLAADRGEAGGTLKVVAASSRSISLDETFARPLAIGYLGFDVEILESGLPGPPIATHAILERRAVEPVRPGTAFFTPSERAYKRALRKVRDRDEVFYVDTLNRIDPALVERFGAAEGAPYERFTAVLGDWRREAWSQLRMAVAMAALDPKAAEAPEEE